MPNDSHQLQLLVPIVVMITVAVPTVAPAQDGVDADERRTLAQAIDLAGPVAGALPIGLVGRPHHSATSGIEAWTTYGEDARPLEILLYTKSAAFRCANRQPAPEWQCRLKLASVIVHEAWHFTHNRDEADAYDVQRAFLIGNHASPELLGGVARSRDVAVVRQRRLTKATDPRIPRQGAAGEGTANKFALK